MLFICCFISFRQAAYFSLKEGDFTAMTAILTTLVPVLFMIGLGYCTKVRKIITPEQKDGANKIVFTILFPFMIFNLLASTDMKPDLFPITLYILACYLVFFFVSRTFLKKLFHPYETISPYLLTTAEGGNLAVPLVLSLIPNDADPILLDIAGVIFCFVLIPVFMTYDEARQKQSARTILHSVLTNSFVIAAFLGILANVTGLYNALIPTGFGQVYTSTMNTITSPIVGMILFIIGYNMDFSWKILQPCFKFVAVRIGLFALIIAGFFLLFPARMADAAFMVAVMIYFMGPVGFGVVMQITPLMKNEKEEAYASGVISLNILFVLAIYILLVIWQKGGF